MEESECIPFDVVLRWVKVYLKFHFYSSFQTARDLIDDGTTRGIDAYADLAAMPDLVSDKVSTQIGGSIPTKNSCGLQVVSMRTYSPSSQAISQKRTTDGANYPKHSGVSRKTKRIMSPASSTKDYAKVSDVVLDLASRR